MTDLRITADANRNGDVEKTFIAAIDAINDLYNPKQPSVLWPDENDTPIFDTLAAEIHVINVDKGFWGPPEQMDKWVAKIALIHSELTEILEALRKSQGADKVTEEFADVFIRALDLYDVLVAANEADPNLTDVINKKIAVNRDRPSKHGNRWG